jgi:hypothetical protein
LIDNNLEQRVFSCETTTDFDCLAMDVFLFQFNNCKVYREFCLALGNTTPSSVEEIPFLPISFFKTHKVIQQTDKPDADYTLFLSSGTSSTARSRHFVPHIEMYERSFLETYKKQVGDPQGQIIFALLPNYLEQGNSSLVYMVDKLIACSKAELSGFYLNDLQGLKSGIEKAKLQNKQVVLFGVSFALLDFCKLNVDCSNVLIIETGGMKGRRKELLKEELHALLKQGLKTTSVSSEYGMTELLSQSYLQKDNWFYTPSWMKIKIRDINDPLSYVSDLKTGAINVIDLANLYSCSFIATDDLGVVHQEKFKVLGRVDYSDIRGCNLMVQ